MKKRRSASAEGEKRLSHTRQCSGNDNLLGDSAHNTAMREWRLSLWATQDTVADVREDLGALRTGSSICFVGSDFRFFPAFISMTALGGGGSHRYRAQMLGTTEWKWYHGSDCAHANVKVKKWIRGSRVVVLTNASRMTGDAATVLQEQQCQVLVVFDQDASVRAVSREQLYPMVAQPLGDQGFWSASNASSLVLNKQVRGSILLLLQHIDHWPIHRPKTDDILTLRQNSQQYPRRLAIVDAVEGNFATIRTLADVPPRSTHLNLLKSCMKTSPACGHTHLTEKIWLGSMDIYQVHNAVKQREQSGWDDSRRENNGGGGGDDDKGRCVATWRCNSGLGGQRHVKPSRSYVDHRCSPRCLMPINADFNPSAGSPLLRPLAAGFIRLIVVDGSRLKSDLASPDMEFLRASLCSYFDRFPTTSDPLTTGRVCYVAPCGRLLPNDVAMDAFLCTLRSASQFKLSPDLFDFSLQVEPDRCSTSALTMSHVRSTDFSKQTEGYPIKVIDSVESKESKEDLRQLTKVRYMHAGLVGSCEKTNNWLSRLSNSDGCVGCFCMTDCSTNDDCSCRKMAQKWMSRGASLDYRFGRYISSNSTSKLVVQECNDNCLCNRETCQNRVVQRNRIMPVEIFYTGGRGFGVLATCDIPPGTYIGYYAGELLLDSQELDEIYVGADDYFFDVTLDSERQDGDEFLIDAKNCGNFTRLINHSCEPNLSTASSLVGTQERYVSLPSFFARDFIKAGTELTINYDYPLQGKGSVPCQCSSPNCRGFLR